MFCLLCDSSLNQKNRFPVFSCLLIYTLLSAATAAAQETPILISLEQAIDMALKQNRSIINAQHAVDFSELNLSTAYASFDVKTTPYAGGGITDGDESFNSGISFSKKLEYGMEVALSPYLSKNDEDYGTAVGLSLEIPLFKNFGRLVNTQSIKTSEYSVRSSKRAFTRTQENVLIETVTAYYNIIEQKKNVELNQVLVDKFRQHTAIAQIKTNAGLAQPLDVYRAQIKEKDAEVSLADALENLQTAYNNLKSVLSIPQAEKIAILDILSPVVVMDLDEHRLQTIAFENSLEIKSALDALNEQKRAAKIAAHYLLPDLTLFFDYTRTGTDDDFDDDILRMNEDSWRIYLTSSTDFSRSAEKNSFRQSLIAVRSSELTLESTRDQLSKDVKNQVDFLEKTRERMAILEQQIQQATGKLELSKIKFNNGMADNFDMIEAETELHRAKLNQLSAQIDYTVGTYRLRKTIGTLIEVN